MKYLNKFVVYLLIFLLGIYSTIIYFLYRARHQFIPDLEVLTQQSDIGMIEVFEWPLDILFPTVPIFLFCIVYGIGLALYILIKKNRLQ